MKNIIQKLRGGFPVFAVLMILVSCLAVSASAEGINEYPYTDELEEMISAFPASYGNHTFDTYVIYRAQSTHDDGSTKFNLGACQFTDRNTSAQFTGSKFNIASDVLNPSLYDKTDWVMYYFDPVSGSWVYWATNEASFSCTLECVVYIQGSVYGTGVNDDVLAFSNPYTAEGVVARPEEIVPDDSGDSETVGFFVSVTSCVSSIISWLGEFVTSVLFGDMSGLLPLVGFGVSVSLLFVAFKLIHSSCGRM